MARLARRWFRMWLLLGALPLAAQATTASDALRAFIDQVRTFQADFTQVQTDEKGRLVKTQSGRMWLSRPTAAAPDRVGRFRWDYQKPYEQLIVNDGKQIWVYDPDLKQVTVRPARQALAGSPAELLSQRSALNQAFEIEDGGSKGGVQKVRLVPRAKDSDFKSIDLSLRDGVPVRMVFEDRLGDSTTVRFSQVKTNAPIAADRFIFVPPPGVEVVGAGSGGTQ